MSDRGELPVKKPVSLWNKPLQANFKDLFKSLGKAAISSTVGNWAGLGEGLVDTTAAVGLQEEPGEIAWLLIYRSLGQAMSDLAESNQDLLLVKKANARALEEFCKSDIVESLENIELTLTSDFFGRPKDLPILEPIKTPFAQWLQSFGIEAAQARSMADRLPSYFVFALEEEWKNRPKDYARLQEALDTPFTKASDRERGWQRYSAWLQRQVDEPMFAEPFSLKQVYVPLRAYYKKRKSEEELEPDFEAGLPRRARQAAGEQDKQDERVVVDLQKAIEAWLEEGNKDDATRVISGGPGSGKSSFAKTFAAQQAEIGNIPVLFVPLHQFNPSDDLVDAIGDWVRDDPDRLLPDNPLDPDNRERRLLIVFDGLDELAMSGKIAAEIAGNFLREVQRKLERFNQRETRLQVLISGRELAIQANASDLRKPEQILHILPYFISEEEREDYLDPEQLLARDDRSSWWANYGAASGRGYTAMPPELDRKNLLEITTQPLLNYLVALSLVRGKMQLSDQSNQGSIYEDLLTAVYERGWASSQHPTLQGVTEKQFIRILEEIGLASWHGDGRTTTVKEIESHCDRSGLKPLLEKFQEGAKAGVTRLLTAFYFRQSGHSTEGDNAFEFTHKSFGEYLTAKRILRAVRRIHKMLERRQQEPDDGWDEREALTYWASLCGPSTMDGYLFDFIFAEVQLQDISEVRKWQQDFCQLIGFMLRHGMPMERLDPRPAYREESRQAHNAEEALLAVLNACARATQKISQIKWPDDTQSAFGAWMARLQGQRTSGDNVLALQCLSFLYLSGCNLWGRNLSFANLVGANLDGANLDGANLYGAILDGANLYGANLFRANLDGANLVGAILVGANLVGANLVRAILDGANLVRANLDGANLDGAILDGAILDGANLVGANLVRANLVGANLKGAIIDEEVRLQLEANRSSETPPSSQ